MENLDVIKAQYPELNQKSWELLAELRSWYDLLDSKEQEQLQQIIQRGSYVEEVFGVWGKEV